MTSQKMAFFNTGIVLGSKVPIDVIMKMYIFWDLVACSLLKFNPCFGAICCLTLHGPKITQVEPPWSSKQNYFDRLLKEHAVFYPGK
jgi:hypothetical protein